MIILQAFKNLCALLCIVTILNACNSDLISVSSDQQLSPTITYSGSKLGQQFNNLLLAEIYNQLGEPKLSVSHYELLSKQTTDPVIMRRATEVAAKTGQLKSGLQLAKHWADISTNNLEAMQYLALLQLRNGKFQQSADQLHVIRNFIEKNKPSKDTKELFNQGLRFIGSMLSVESHKKQSYTVFQLYLKKFGSKVHQTQQYLILASLAMKAKEYDVVLSSFNKINNSRTETIPEIVMMRAKALQNLKRIGDAVDVLKTFVDQQDSSDSIKLELVRLLILDNQKQLAGGYLNKLVKEYPDNRDLLKSLIALDIDLSKFDVAKANIKRLRQSEDYQSDAEYFTGEVLEAEGHLRNALTSYKRVKKGSLLKRAQKKILVLNQKLGKSEITKVNFKKNKSESVKE